MHDDVKWKKNNRGVAKGDESNPGFMYKQGVLLYKDRLVIAEKSSWIPKLLEEFHSTPQARHLGF